MDGTPRPNIRRLTPPANIAVQTYRSILEESADVICIIDEQARIIELSRSFHALLGYTREDLLGRDVRELMPSGDLQERPIPLAALREGRVLRYDRNFVRKDGSLVPMELTAQALSDGTFMTIARNIEDRKAVEALRETQAKQYIELQNQAHVLENIAEGVNYVDNRGIIRFTNAAFNEMFGYEPGELIGKPAAILNDLEPAENIRLVAEILATLATDGIWIGEFKNRKKDGTSFITQAKIKKLPLQGEAHWVTVQEDITAKKQTESALRQMHKMESLGSLAAGIAHDFNNILTVILGHADVLDAVISRESDLHEDVEQIKIACDHAVRLTRQLLVFSRKQLAKPQPLDMNVIVRDTSRMLTRLLGEDIRLSISLSSLPCTIIADASEVEQLLLNLVVNARDAMPKGGSLTIKTNIVTIAKNDASMHPGAMPGPHVVLSVADTGHGIDPKIRQRIFDPFFTTKSRGKGTGLGLATVHGIITQCGGHVTVESEMGRGSIFRVYLPLSSGTTATTKPSPVVSQIPKLGQETILVVEDDALVRHFVVGILRRVGYAVFEAENPLTALKATAERRGDIDLLLTDVVMPDLSGRELAEQLGAIYPRIQVVYMSGYTDDAVLRHGIETNEIAFLRKPFTKDALLQKLRESLDTARALAISSNHTHHDEAMLK
ncbi:MAG TPA: PAS domain S-box protein [Polyangium sp.]|nr:PAS domain S-box protein [Polyangium sp.]